MTLEIIPISLLEKYKELVTFDVASALHSIEAENTPVDYFAFYNSISTVYSSKIEGENIDYDSYFKYRFLNVEYQPDYTKKADDLYLAYEFIFKNNISLENLLKAHSILSSNLLPISQQGKVRNNPMLVINADGRIEYVAADASEVNIELNKLFDDIETLMLSNISEVEIFYFAAFIHLVFVKIHPFQDGNGRSARLLEKWFLIKKFDEKATAIQLEKNYYNNLQEYYKNIKVMGIEYQNLNYEKAMPFLLMTISTLRK